jgi:transcriptional regulator with XRE-family HTH domain
MKDNEFKKVRDFLKGLNPIQFRYLELTVQLAAQFQSLIQGYGLSKEKFCELFEIKPAQYNNYIKGNYNYSVNDMAMLTAVYRKLETERVQKEELVKIAGNE